MVEYTAVHIVPCHRTRIYIQHHVSVCAARFGQADRAGIEVQETTFRSERLPRGDMCMSMQQDITRHERGRIIRIVNMTVRCVQQPFPNRQYGIVRQHGEGQHHLIHFGIAVSANAEQPICQRVQLCNDGFGGIPLRQIIARSVIQNIPQQEQPIRVFP